MSDDGQPIDPFGRPSNVDWGRHQVRSRALDNTGRSYTALGPPSQWGNSADLNVLLAAGGLGGVGTATVPQLLRAQVQDLYSRNWTILGTLSVPSALTNISAPTNHPVLTSDVAAALLHVLMGVGQNAVSVAFDLAALITAASPFYFAQIIGDKVTLPWVISGGVSAQALAVGASLTLDTALFAPGTVVTTRIDAQMSVFAAGTGL